MRILPISFKINTFNNTQINKTTPFPTPTQANDSFSFSGVKREASKNYKESTQNLAQGLKQKTAKEIATIKNKVKNIHQKAQFVQKEATEIQAKTAKVQETAKKEFEAALKVLENAQKNNWEARKAENGKLSREFIFLKDNQEDLMGSCIMRNSKGEEIRIIRFKTNDSKITPYKIITNKTNKISRYGYNNQGELKSSSVVTYGEEAIQEDYDFSKGKLIGYGFQKKTEGKEIPTENLYYFNNDGTLSAVDKGFLQTEDGEIWIEEEFNFSKDGLTSYYELYTKSPEENTKTYKKFIDFQKAKDSFIYESNFTEDAKGNTMTGKRLIVKAGEAQDYYVNLAKENNRQVACSRHVDFHNGKIQTISLGERALGKETTEIEKLFNFKNNKLTSFAKNATTVSNCMIDCEQEIIF